MDLVRASLSKEGFELTHSMMLINGFLGEVVGLENVLGEFSYNFAVYGTPDVRAPGDGSSMDIIAPSTASSSRDG